MARKGGGFGMVILVVVMAVVLLLVARAWKSMAPTAAQLPAAQSTDGIDPHGQDDAAEAAGGLPNLEETRQETDRHKQQVQEALENIE